MSRGAGTYEKIRTSVLDDPTLTDAESRLVLYLASRPPGWVVIPAVVAKETKRNERYWVRPTLRLLAARGIVTATRVRKERGQLGEVTYQIRRDLLIAPDAVEPAPPGPARNRMSSPSSVRQSMVPPAETQEEHGYGQAGPRAASQSVVPPAETQNPRSDHGLPDSALSDNRRVRTDRELRTEEVQDPETVDQLTLIATMPGGQDSSGFDAFWAVYPRKVGKIGAKSCYDRAVKKGADPRQVIAGAVRYRDDPNRAEEFTKHPSTWLNQGCWDDAPLPARRSGAGRLDRVTQAVQKNRVNGQPSAAMRAFGRLAGVDDRPSEESRREITS